MDLATASRLSKQNPAVAQQATRAHSVAAGVLRRGAATDLMGQVGDALAAPRSAYVHVQIGRPDYLSWTGWDG